MSRASMKEAMKNYKRISSPNEINSEAAMNLAKEILIETHDEYINALVDIHRLNKVKKVRELTKQEKKDLKDAKQTKEDDEAFYVSRAFQVYTLNNGYSGYTIIERLRKEARDIIAAADKNKKRNI